MNWWIWILAIPIFLGSVWLFLRGLQLGLSRNVPDGYFPLATIASGYALEALCVRLKEAGIRYFLKREPRATNFDGHGDYLVHIQPPTGGRIVVYVSVADVAAAQRILDSLKL